MKTIKIEHDVWKRLKLLALEKEIRITDVVRILLEKYDEKGNKNG